MSPTREEMRAEGLKAIKGSPLGPVLTRVAGIKVQRLLGYWVMWHAFGGLEPLIASGLLSRAGVYAQRNEFSAVFGVSVEDFQLGPSLVPVKAG